jgi:hypothetical protein
MLLRGGRDGRTAVAANGKAGIGWFLRRAALQTRGLYGSKCIFLQWIAGSIFMKCEYPEKHNEINGLDAAIPCNRAGV